MALGDAAVTVLGNHDLHLLTVAAGHRAGASRRHDRRHPRRARSRRADRLADAASAGRARGRAADGARRTAAVVDAGARADAFAGGAGEACERGRGAGSFRCSTATSRSVWRDDLAGRRPPARDRQRLHAAALLHGGRSHGVPREARRARTRPKDSAPWFMHPERRSAHVLVVCGHWSTLELTLAPNVLMLDSGCLWGGPLTGGELAGSARVPGAVAAAGKAKAVRIAPSASRASSRRCWSRARQSAPTRSLRR